MVRRPALPDALSRAPFTTGKGRDAGLSASRLRAQDIDVGVWGVRSASSPTSLEERCLLLAARMPSDAWFSGTTAALLHGLPVPLRVEQDERVDVCVPSPARAPHARGIRGHRSSLLDVTRLPSGLRISTVTQVWIEVALPLPDLVALGDAMIRPPMPLTTVQELEILSQKTARRRGARSRAQAIPLLDGRSESPQESRLRTILHQQGFERPLVNTVVTDRHGRFVARTDLQLPSLGVVLEYQGDHHRDQRQWRADMSRRALLEATTGMRVMELNADDLRQPLELAVRIRALAALR